MDVVQCKTVEELVKASDIICTATPSEEPVLPDDRELLEGKCIIAIGSYTPQMREIPDAIWDLVDKVYIELPYACEESGDLSQPLAEGRLTMDRVRCSWTSSWRPGRTKMRSQRRPHISNLWAWVFLTCAWHRNYWRKQRRGKR